MILQVLTDARQIGNNINTELAQIFALADAREQQHLRTVNRAARQDHFLARLGNLDFIALLVFNADGLLAIEQNTMRQRIDFNFEIRAAERRHKVSNRCAATLVVLDCGLIRPHAFLLRAVEIIRIGMACLLSRLDESIKQHVALLSVGYAERAVASVEGT